MLIGLIPFGVLSGIGSLVFWLGKRWVAHRRNWRIYLYEYGLIYHAQDLYPMHWSSAQSIIHKIVKHTYTYTTRGRHGHTHTTKHTSYTHHYKIYCKDSTELAARGVIGGSTFYGVSELIQTIEQRSAPYLLGEAIHLLKSTGQAPFGALTVNQQGLLVRGNFLPWQELKSFSISGTAVAFRKKGKWFTWQSCELGDVVNYEVFKQLVSMFV